MSVATECSTSLGSLASRKHRESGEPGPDVGRRRPTAGRPRRTSARRRRTPPQRSDPRPVQTCSVLRYTPSASGGLSNSAQVVLAKRLLPDSATRCATQFEKWRLGPRRRAISPRPRASRHRPEPRQSPWPVGDSHAQGLPVGRLGGFGSRPSRRKRLPRLAVIGMIETRIEKREKVSLERRYYISSRPLRPRLSPMRCAANGASRTAFIGFSTSPSKRTSSPQGRPRRSQRGRGAPLALISSDRPRTSAPSSDGVKSLHGTRNTSPKCYNSSPVNLNSLPCLNPDKVCQGAELGQSSAVFTRNVAAFANREATLRSGCRGCYGAAPALQRIA